MRLVPAVLLLAATPAFAHEAAHEHTHGLPVAAIVVLLAGFLGLIWYALAQSRRRRDGND